MPRIPQETIEQIAAANDIVEVIGAYFPLKRTGATWKALCPFHQERSPSFTVNPQRQIFKCFGCGAGGSVFRFVMDYEHIDFTTAVRRLADRAGIRIIEEELSPEDNARLSMRRRLLALHAEAASWFHAQLLRKPSAQVARDYLKRRGISAEVAKAWEAFSAWAQSRGYSREELIASGLVKLRDEDRPQGEFYDRFRARVMFPICNDLGEVIAFSGRVLEADAKAAKYVNSPETMLFTKGSVLFGLHKTKRAVIEKQSAIVCEGQLDLITAFENGVANVIAAQGTAFTEKQARTLKRLLPEGEVVLCFDADAAGEKAAERSLASLLAEGLAVRVAAMPPGEDPDSLIRREGVEAFRRRIADAKDFFDFQLERLSMRPDFATPRGRAQAVRKLAGWVGLIGEVVLRDAVVNRLATRLEVSAQEFSKLVTRPAVPRTAEEQDSTAVAEPTALDPTVRLIALVALHDAEARAWLLAAPWRELLAREPEAALAIRILEANLRPDDPSSLNAFLSTLDVADEAAVANLLEEGPRPNALQVATDCWTELVRRQIRRRLDAIQARLRAPELSADEVMRLNKELIDLKQRIP
jgi:DNA primase